MGAERALLTMFEQEGIKLIGSPDYFVYQAPLFGVDDARRLTEQAINKAFIDRKVFLIAPKKITLEAQNALLKTFEEPVEKTHFLLVVRDESVILPTLRSRLEVMRLDEEGPDLVQAEKFLKASIKDRLTWVKKFIDKEENLSTFLDLLLLALREKSEASQALQNVYHMRLESDARGASPRLILEHLALVL